MTITHGHIHSKRIQIDDEIRQAVLNQLDKSVYYGGEQAYRLELEFAGYLGAGYAVSVNSGTSALLVALVALGIRPGDEILVPANTYITSAEVPTFLGATPVFCDVEYDTANVTKETLSARLTERTRAIIPTHLYGHPVDMDPVLALAKEHGLFVIEMCPHALGAEYKGKKIGTIGDAAVFSLGSKNISVAGTGGMVVTNSKETFTKAVRFSRHGWPRGPVGETYFDDVVFNDSPSDGMFPIKRDSLQVGLNLQLDEIPSAIGRIALKRLEGWNTRRREIASLYTGLIAEAGIAVEPLCVRPWAKHSYLHYVVRAEGRDAVRQELWSAGIEAKLHYPIPLPEIEFYRERFPTDPNAYPVTRRLVSEIMSLPMHPWLKDEDVKEIVDRMAQFLCSLPLPKGGVVR